MRKIIIYYLFIIITFNSAVISHAQVSSIYQNFDVPCVTTPYFPANWLLYNPIPATATYGAWTCSANDGNHNTPGLECTNYYNGAYHLDTSYLITPMLNFHNYLGHHLYLRFDSRASSVVAGSELTILRTPLPDSAVSGSLYNLGLNSTVYPALGSADSIGWVTHEIDMTPSENYGNFYLTFMYTATPASGSIWYIDNVVTDSLSMKTGVPIVPDELLPVTVVGPSTREEINLSFSAPVAGQYHLAIYDMIGREVFTELLSAKGGNGTYSIKGLSLHCGMYCIKMENGEYYGIAKAMVQ